MKKFLLLPGAIWLFASAPGVADPIYKSIDAKGRVSYGDMPPQNAVTIEVLDIQTPETPLTREEVQARINELAATTARLQKDRQAREEDRRQAAQAMAPPPPPVYYPQPAFEPEATYYLPGSRYHHPLLPRYGRPPYRGMLNYRDGPFRLNARLGQHPRNSHEKHHSAKGEDKPGKFSSKGHRKSPGRLPKPLSDSSRQFR